MMVLIILQTLVLFGSAARSKTSAFVLPPTATIARNGHGVTSAAWPLISRRRIRSSCSSLPVDHESGGANALTSSMPVIEQGRPSQPVRLANQTVASSTSISAAMKRPLPAKSQTKKPRKSLSSSSSTPSSATEDSVSRAMDHLTAILSLYDDSIAETNHDKDQHNSGGSTQPPPTLILHNECDMYADILLSAFHEMIQFLLSQPQEKISAQIMNEIRSFTRALFERRQKPQLDDVPEHCYKQPLTPRENTLHLLWTLYQGRYHNILNESSGASGIVISSSTRQEVVDWIQHNLEYMSQWRHWSFQSALAQPCPPSFRNLLHIVEAAATFEIPIMRPLWDMYRCMMDELIEQEANFDRHGALRHMQKPPPPALFSRILLVLSLPSHSRADENLRRKISVFRDLFRLYESGLRARTSSQKDRLHRYLPDSDDLFEALHNAATLGCAPEAAWLTRALKRVEQLQAKGQTEALENESSTFDDVTSQSISLFWKSMEQSTSASSYLDALEQDQ